MAKPHVVILGAGPAGMGAAYRLRKQDRAEVTILERRTVVGGNAGSFEASGQRLDYGSHRLNYGCSPEVFADIKALLGDDLLMRPRHGRILLRGRWIHFPLRPLDLLLRLDRRFALGIVRDMLGRSLGRRNPEGDTFASVLQARLGPTICQHFYFPYARKIWGRAPEKLSATQARRRVAADSFAKVLRNLLARSSNRQRDSKAYFHYPRNGYGQISEAYAEAARADGATFLLGWTVTRLERSGSDARPWIVVAEQDGVQRTFQPDYVWSTLPVSLLARLVTPAAPPEVLDAARALTFRAMLLIYLEIPTQRFTEYDAHYFPETAIAITRLSEPKNYAATTHPEGRTTLCAELPCTPDDAYWTMPETELARRVAHDLDRAAIPLPHPPTSVHVKRLRYAYPIYPPGYEVPFGRLDAWADQLPRLLTYGRQGLFAHDNTHHALAMAYAAAACLSDDGFDDAAWQAHRKVFETHIIED